MIDAATGDSPPPLVSTFRHGPWAEIRLERAAKRNAMSWALAEELMAALRTLADGETAAVVLSAAGPVFCAGGDRQEAREGTTPPFAELQAALHAAPFFLIARVEGDVVGGGMALLAACPVVLCLSSVTFLLPAAGAQDVFPAGFLPALGDVAGERALLEFALRSEPLSAHGAKTMGLVNAVVGPDLMDATVAEWLELVRSRPSAASGARRFWRERRVAQLEAPVPLSGSDPPPDWTSP
jgi:enoyl-CoA hydratase/carnithine racemase